MKTDSRQFKKVFSLDKAMRLEQMGNSILFTVPNRKNKDLKVFCFANTLKLNKDWDRIEQMKIK